MTPTVQRSLILGAVLLLFLLAVRSCFPAAGGGGAVEPPRGVQR